ncbi:MAG: ABC transporter substrate-binding protein [Porticoccaceae bacterium]|nr:ABC transporter substrate-binding protein [Porticoccaceae bacterium]
MDTVKTGLRSSILALTLALFAPLILAQASQPKVEADPYAQVEQITVELLEVIGQHSEQYPANEAEYFAALGGLLDTNVDFKFIARSVMGPYAKKASSTQRATFAEKFRQGLIETYGRGLIGYSDQQIILLDHEDLKAGQRRVTVKQEIRGDDGVYPLAYSMARKKTGQWMVINMTINGISLGKTFRSQFVQSAQRAGGDIDATIAGWSSEST